MKSSRRSVRRSYRRAPGMSIWAKLGIAGGVLAFVGLICGLMAIVQKDKSADCSSYGGVKFKANLSQCLSDKDFTYNRIAIVVGNTANSPAPKMNDRIKNYLFNSALGSEGGAKISVYSAASDHRRILTKRVGIKSDSEEFGKEVEKASKEFELVEKAMLSEPTADGADYWSAIDKAVRDLGADSDMGGRGLVLVLGSGLSDTGQVLNFVGDNILDSRLTGCGKGGGERCTAEEIIQRTKERSGLDELGDMNSYSDINVSWYGCGSTSSPQRNLTSEEQDFVQDLYLSLFAEMGLDNDEVSISKESVDGPSIETDHTVELVNTENGYYKGLFEEKYGSEAHAFGAGSELDYIPDSDQFLRVEDAKSVLEILAQDLKSDHIASVTISGYIARTVCDGATETTSDLGLKRAETAMDVLTSEYGVNPEKVIVENGGLGTRADECAGGSIDKNAQKQNRYVEIKIKNRS